MRTYNYSPNPMSSRPLLTTEEAYRIKLQLLAAEAGGVTKFAQKIGKSAAQVSQWINGSKDSKTGKPRSIRPESLRGIEQALGKPKGWIDALVLQQKDWMADGAEGYALEEIGAPQLTPPPVPDAVQVVIATPESPNFYAIPKVKLQLRAGVTGFQTVPDIYDGSTISVPKNWVDRNGYRIGALIAITIKGDSMEPNLYEGDMVIINTDDKKMVDGTVYAFNYEGEAVIKRLVRERGSWWLFSDNQDQSRHRPRGCTEGECIIIGRVVKRETERI